MRIDCRGRFRSIVVTSLAVCLAFVWALPADQASAQANVMRIEEDWELELIQPDAKLDAPQVLVVFSPLGEGNDNHFEVDINHASLPYASGGLQIRAVQGDESIEQQRLLDGERLTVESDVISWTQIAERQTGGIAFGITNGLSESWGPFGDATTYVTLPSDGSEFQYVPTHSLNRSGVTYAGNRVRRLTLVRVRYVDSFGNTTEVPINLSVQ